MATPGQRHPNIDKNPHKSTLYVILIIMFFLLLCWVIWLYFDYKIREIGPVSSYLPDTSLRQIEDG